MAVFLLDTTVIVDALNGKRARSEFLDALLAQRNLLACCSINVTEVFAGVRPNEIGVTEAFLQSLRFYEVTWDIARLAGDLKRQWRGKGLTLSLPDVTIAAVALAHRLILLTDNKKHFPMPELLLQALP
jgi:predicted nucleic acid-binding protein